MGFVGLIFFCIVSIFLIEEFPNVPPLQRLLIMLIFYFLMFIFLIIFTIRLNKYLDVIDERKEKNEMKGKN